MELIQDLLEAGHLGGRSVLLTLDKDFGQIAIQSDSPSGRRRRGTKTSARCSIKQKDIDAVTIGMPDHMHLYCALHAVQAGNSAPFQRSDEQANVPLLPEALSSFPAGRLGNSWPEGSLVTGSFGAVLLHCLLDHVARKLFRGFVCEVTRS